LNFAQERTDERLHKHQHSRSRFQGPGVGNRLSQFHQGLLTEHFVDYQNDLDRQSNTSRCVYCSCRMLDISEKSLRKYKELSIPKQSVPLHTLYNTLYAGPTCCEKECYKKCIHPNIPATRTAWLEIGEKLRLIHGHGQSPFLYSIIGLWKSFVCKNFLLKVPVLLSVNLRQSVVLSVVHNYINSLCHIFFNHIAGSRNLTVRIFSRC
jgi:hypothetical protein